MNVDPQTIDPSDRGEVVKAIMGAWCRHDIDTVLGYMSPEIVWHYHVGSKPIRGTATMRKMLEGLAGHQLQGDWRMVQHAVAGNSVLLEGVDDYHDPEGNHVQAPYMGVFEFDPASGLVIGWRDYVDMALLTGPSSGEPLAEWVAGLCDRGERVAD